MVWPICWILDRYMDQKLSPELLDGCKNWMINLSKAEIVIEHTEYETMIRTAKIDGKKTYDSVLYFSVIEATISVKKFWQSISVKFPLLSSVALPLFSLTSLFISRI